MLIVAVISQKGDSGKTTLATNLTGQATLIVDLDPQASATSWADSREADTPVVVSAQAARLEEVLATASRVLGPQHRLVKANSIAKIRSGEPARQ